MTSLRLPSSIIPSRRENNPSLNNEIFDSSHENFLFHDSVKFYSNKLAVVHDGPPYANGDIHYGHVMNKILKDTVARLFKRNGYNISFKLGWDCHGLPIENRVYENNKTFSSVESLRKECYKVADKYVGIQRESFTNLNILCDRESVFKTSDISYIIDTLKVFYHCLERGYIKVHNMPTHFSVTSQTSHAFSEIEYKKYSHTSLYVPYPLLQSDLHILIWTTTPWTLYANSFITMSSSIPYTVCMWNSIKVIVSESFAKENSLKPLSSISIESILNYTDPIDLCIKRVIFNSEFVRADEGTGSVHCAPSHGSDDYFLSLKYPEIQIKENCINKNGFLIKSAVGNLELSIYDEERLINALKDIWQKFNLPIEELVYEHMYPFSWRDKKPLCFYSSRQIFLDLNHDSLRDKISQALSYTNWYDKHNLETFKTMLNSRDHLWCLTRQRKYGIPIAVFINRRTNEILFSKSLNDVILKSILKHKSLDIWYDENFIREIKKNFDLGEEWEPNYDVFDVWFESGCSELILKNEFLISRKYRSKRVVYIEGVDQHRGWFQSSTILMYIYTGKLPYNDVIVHGHVCLNSSKMSKSSNMKFNIQEHDTDVLRLWILSSKYYSDIEYSQSIIEAKKSEFLRIRQVMRFLINFTYEGYKNIEYIQIDQYSSYILNCLQGIKEKCSNNAKKFKFNEALKDLISLTELISEYITTVKSCLYCYNPDLHNYQSFCSVLKYMSNVMIEECFLFLPNLYSEIISYIKKSNLSPQKIFAFPTIKFSENYFDFSCLDSLKFGLNRVRDTLKKNKLIKYDSSVGVCIRNKTLYNSIRHVDPILIYDLLGTRFVFDSVFLSRESDKDYNVMFNVVEDQGDFIFMQYLCSNLCDNCRTILLPDENALCVNCVY